MFDLSFFKIVGCVLDWKEAPPARFINEHQEATSHKKNHKCAFDDAHAHVAVMHPTEKLLRLYVRATYPRYFGLTLHVGETPRRFIDKCFVE